MDEQARSAEFKTNLWSPWRMEYIDSLSAPDGGCFLCRARDNPAADAENYVLWRGRRMLAILNRFPYTGGHTLIAPLAHVPGLADLDDAGTLELMGMVRDAQGVLAKAIHAEGFNVGINIGRCAGAGLPGHLHVHVVPRWGGDTNFMAVAGDVRVIPVALAKLRKQMLEAGAAMGLRK